MIKARSPALRLAISWEVTFTRTLQGLRFCMVKRGWPGFTRSPGFIKTDDMVPFKGAFTVKKREFFPLRPR